MGSFCKSPSPPPPPDPVAVANAQSAANIQTAQEQQKLNMVNTYGPNGSVVYATDPSAPGGYSQTTTLTPQQQAILDAQQATELGATNIAQDQLGRVNTALQTPLDTSGLPALTGSAGTPNQQTGYDRQALNTTFQTPGQVQTGVNLQSGYDAGGPIQNSYDMGGPIQTAYSSGGPIQTAYDSGGAIQRGFNTGPSLQYGYNSGQQVQGQVGPQNLYSAYQTAADASYQQAVSRLDPQFSLQENQLRQRLADQGLSPDSTAYQAQMDQFNRGKNDAYNQAAYSSQNQGLNAENTLFGQSVQQGQFANSAAAQQYAQNQGLAQFYNQTAGQQFGQNQQAAQFANQAQQQANQQNLQAFQAYNAAQGQQNTQNLAAAQFGNAAQGQQNAQGLAAAQFANQAQNQQNTQNANAATFGNNSALAGGQFANQAQAQQAGQALDAFNATNAARSQQEGLNQSAAGFANSANNTNFNQSLANAGLSNAARNQGLQERAYVQNQPINQLTGLLGLGQVSMPQGIAYTPSQVANTDVIGANALATQAQQAQYQAQLQQQGGLMNGLFSLGSAALMASDVRLKTDVRLIRRRKDGVGVYAFRYRDDPKGLIRIGVMAQELKKVRPDLVVKRADGFWAVDYSALDLEAA